MGTLQDIGDLRHTPLPALKYSMTFIVILILTCVMYLTYWLLMLQVKKYIVDIYDYALLSNDLLSFDSMIAEQALDLLLLKHGAYSLLDPSNRESLSKICYNDLNISLGGERSSRQIFNNESKTFDINNKLIYRDFFKLDRYYEDKPIYPINYNLISSFNS